MLGQRLDTLEADLRLLIAMQDLILGESEFIHHPPTTSTKSSHFFSNTSNIPERDVSRPRTREKTRDKIHGSKLHVDITNTQKLNDKARDTNPENGDVGDPLAYSNPVSLTAPAALEKLTMDLKKEKVILQQSIENEKRLRTEAEDSAKKMYIKLQRAEDDLAREKQTKESLLLGTLQLKNLVQNFNTRMKEADGELQESKAQIQQLKVELKDLSDENANLLNHIESLCREMGYRNDEMSFYSGKPTILYFEFLRKKFQDLVQKSVGKEHEQVNKLALQLNNVVGRCAKLERERDNAFKQFEQCKQSEEHLKDQLQTCGASLATMESDLLKKQFEYDCMAQKLQAEIQQSKDQAQFRISEYASLIHRSKSLLVSLKVERDTCRKAVRELRSANQDLDSKLKAIENERHCLINEIDQLKRKMMDEMRDRTLFYEKSQGDILKHEMNMKRAEAEKKRCMELLNEMKNQLIHMKNKNEHENAMQNVEKERLKNENSRLDENFRVIQKISEDQGRTIQKLRGELETLKSASFKWETQMREHECTEDQLIKKLDVTQKQNDRYRKQIEELEEKIEKYTEDVRQHDCEDYADSRYKRKLVELEKCFQESNTEWQESLKRLEKEKKEAIETAKKAVQKIDEVKNAYNTQIAEVRSANQSEVGRLVEQQRKADAQKMAKIKELQSELDRLKLSSSQIQRALSTKIQQLQTALSICLGAGSNPTHNSSLGPSLHQFHPQQQPQLYSAGAFGNPTSLGNNGFANNNAASNANLLLNNGQHSTCWGNSDVNGCTSGVVSGDVYPQTGSLLHENGSGGAIGGVDFVGNNLI